MGPVATGMGDIKEQNAKGQCENQKGYGGRRFGTGSEVNGRGWRVVPMWARLLVWGCVGGARFASQQTGSVWWAWSSKHRPVNIEGLSNEAAWAMTASASVKFLTICSGVCNLRFIRVCFQRIKYSYRMPSNPQWYSLLGPGYCEGLLIIKPPIFRPLLFLL